MMLFIGTIVLPVYGIKNEIQKNSILLEMTSNAEWSMKYGDDKFEMLQ